jgi:hypothetical protein
MPSIKLTARRVQSIKPTRGKRAEYFDTQVPGLALRVTENGAKSWTILYRHRGRLRRLTLGSVAVIDLADAREQAKEKLRAANKGADPASEKHERRRAKTIGDLATDYIERHAKRKKRSWKDDDRMLRTEVLPDWEHKAIEDIKRRDVRGLVDAIAERGALRTIPACRVPRCPDRGTHRGYCERKRGSAAARGYDATWRKLRAEHLKAHPWCVECGVEAEGRGSHRFRQTSARTTPRSKEPAFTVPSASQPANWRSSKAIGEGQSTLADPRMARSKGYFPGVVLGPRPVVTSRQWRHGEHRH